MPAAHGLYDPAYEHEACGVAFVVDIKGRRSHDILRQAITALENLLHRGATGSDEDTGDGAGVLLQIPHEFLVAEAESLGFHLPARGEYGVGMVFMPQNPDAADRCRRFVAEAVERTGQRLLGWRDVPTNNSTIGTTARNAEPAMQQCFIGRGPNVSDSQELERKLYLIRRRAETLAAASSAPGAEGHEEFGNDDKVLYISSLSCRTIVYKGMLSADQMAVYFPDLVNPAVVTALAVVHQRFSTNTFPTWSLAHPYRYLAHNGEINTLRGNVNLMHAREQRFESELFGEELEDLKPIIQEGRSDSSALDNALELLVMTGRSLPHAMMMLIPEPWSSDDGMNEVEKGFYNYHASLMEPWDGPAAVTFTDGTVIGAMLDRNGLRPGRYYVTRDDRLVLASEVGVFDVAPEDVFQKGRLEPGKILFVDTAQGRIVPDSELKNSIATEQPYGRWLSEQRVPIDSLPPAPYVPGPDHETIRLRQQIFGFTTEENGMLIAPMAAQGQEALGSMGTDTPLAVLSERPQLLYNYFKQLFAQVTNPPLDGIREELVTSVETALGPERNLLKAEAESCRHIELKSPVLDNDQLARIRHAQAPGFESVTLPMLFRAANGAEGLARAMDELCERASEAARNCCSLLILSDRGVNEEWAPIPSLLATAGVHHHLVRTGDRTRAGVLVESGEAREVHHYCLLLGYGASAINPYLAFETLDDLIGQEVLTEIDHRTAIQNYIKAANKGILKVMSKMGISSLQSYRGAQIFEAIGLDRDFVEKYFRWTPSRIGGVGLDVVAEEVLARHRRAFPVHPVADQRLEWGGQYQWRREGELHLYNPETVYKLQHATRTKQFDVFKEYTSSVDDQSKRLSTIRGLLDLEYVEAPVPLDEVEPAEAIVKRFATGAMSFGSISAEAHETLAIAMNRIGGKSNTGEGGEDPIRNHADRNGDLRRSAIKQVASARFGVTSEYLVNADELQIKMAQGAKPGEGGQLPGHKVDETIARVRHSTPGVGLISPPPHHDVYSIEDLAQLIYDLKNANPRARISVKLVAEVGVGTVAAGVAKAHSDVVLISGHDGGTGASPLTGIKHAGIPWELGVAETQQVLLMNGLRSRIVVQTDGQMKTGRDVVVAALLGAEEYGFATAPLVVLGCIMMRVCHLNTCPVGIATQDPELRKRFDGHPKFVENFFWFIAEEVRELMSKLGYRTMDEMIGRWESLSVRQAVDHWKAAGLDLSSVLQPPNVPSDSPRRCVDAQEHGLEDALDNHLIELAGEALRERRPIEAELPIRNVHRTVGAMLGSEITRRWGGDGLPPETVKLRFKGSAGQSFGAFIPRGLSLELEGDTNDYVGKGLSGGVIAIYPPAGSTFVPEENVLLGNVALYGATSGEAYFNGVAGERFAVRNSGATAVVEGTGDHGCEYMTGGVVVVLGRTGRNFGAGMSGGIAFVLDEDGRFERHCNREMVGLEPADAIGDGPLLREIVTEHLRRTKSPKARRLLDDWDECFSMFVKVVPHDYRRVMLENVKNQEQSVTW